MTYFLLAASIRALCQSVIRSGHHCCGADFFADWDTQVHGDVRRVNKFTDAMAFIDPRKIAGIVYGGGVENHAELIASAEMRVPILGCGSRTVECVRNPFLVAECMRQRGLRTLPVTNSATGRKLDWIEKPLRSVGGNQVRRVRPGTHETLSADRYRQQFVPGQPFSATFVGCGDTCLLIGCSRQLTRKTATSEFAYAGSIGPTALAPQACGAVNEIGQALCQSFQLRGWFGVDFVMFRGHPWLVEVNPRYTASMELFERSGKLELFQWHLDACHGRLDASNAFPPAGDAMWGKRIVFHEGPANLTVTEPQFQWWVEQHETPAPWVTDIPQPETVIAAGQPLCTVWASGSSTRGIRRQLDRRCREVKAQIYSLIRAPHV